MARIVAIEDNPFNMKLTVFLAMSAGHLVLQAVDAESGLELIKTEVPDLILMDIHLPGMDGIAANIALKSDLSLCHIPVIALTAMAMKNEEANILAAGFDGYLKKPFHRQEFIDLLSKTLKN